MNKLLFQSNGQLYEGHIDPRIEIPSGGKGLLFMRDFVRTHKRAGASDGGFQEGFVGFVTYEGDSKFVYVKEKKLVDSSQFTILSNKKINPDYPLPDKEKYFTALSKIKELLAAGETYQVNYSEKFSVKFGGEAEKVFAILVAKNPSSHQFFWETDEFALISNSPECLMRIDATGRITTQPIKGTVQRGRTDEEDAALAGQLLADEKNAAELAMIVDLERNDMGKVCTAGSVRVIDERRIEKYSHVIHTVAEVEGQLRAECDWYDALMALFPGGSVTGCPKKRTMEIIRELEGEPRGIYCGSAGWIDLSGACDFNILIRTAWLDKKTHELTFRSGGGIVADSGPQQEYEEVLHKAAALASTVAACAKG